MPDPKESLHELVDPSLGGDYPIDSSQGQIFGQINQLHNQLLLSKFSIIVLQMYSSLHQIANLAKSCTHEEPKMRPTMRSIVVALMPLSSKIQLRETLSSLGAKGLVNLAPGGITCSLISQQMNLVLAGAWESLACVVYVRKRRQAVSPCSFTWRSK